MVIWVTDRNSLDLNRIEYLKDKGVDRFTPEESAEYEAGMRGSYNISDLNRVDGNMRIIGDILEGLGFWALPLITRIWTENDLAESPGDTEEKLMAYLGNVTLLKGVVTDSRHGLATNYEPPETMGYLSIEGANDIERLGRDMHLFVLSLRNIHQYTGGNHTGLATHSVRR